MIRVVEASKIYKIYQGPRALLGELLLGRVGHRKVSALRDISFEIEAGESFGVIGDNGAGKSTLLKLLTGTAFATSGNVEVQGRVSALLELGTGFHPEFTGRENLYFSGALMGFSRDEIAARERAIVGFSELEDFMDQPVKTYSSGMFVRLGFAVATGFDPDVLIIDEALAVGDQGFQKKCTDRIVRFKREGKTLLFCSHNLHQVRTLCQRALWLDHGEARGLGPAEAVVDRYEDHCRQRQSERGQSSSAQAMPSGGVCRVESVKLVSPGQRDQEEFETGDTLRLQIGAWFSPEFRGKPGLGVALVRNDGIPLYVTVTSLEGIDLDLDPQGRVETELTFPSTPLLAGSYYFNVFTTDDTHLQSYHSWDQAAPFSIRRQGGESGLVSLRHEWRSPGGED